jgi:hypothetical protein
MSAVPLMSTYSFMLPSMTAISSSPSGAAPRYKRNWSEAVELTGTCQTSVTPLSPCTAESMAGASGDARGKVIDAAADGTPSPFTVTAVTR